jgi:hypothetical protein
MRRTLVALMFASAVLVAGPVAAQSSEAACKEAVRAKYPTGTLSRKSGDRERLVAECMAAGGRVPTRAVARPGGGGGDSHQACMERGARMGARTAQAAEYCAGRR